MKNTILKRRELCLAIIVFSLISYATYYEVFTVPPDSEILLYVVHPLTVGTFESFIHWHLVDGVQQTRFLRQAPFFILGAIVSLLNHYDFILRLLSFVLFIFIGLLIFLLLMRENVRFGLALLGGIIFLIHPINAINVTKLIHSAGLLAIMFLLIALNLYVNYRDKPKSIWIFVIEGFCIIFILFSYELFVVSPLFLVLCEFFIKAGGRLRNVNVHKFFPSFVLWSILAAIYLAIRFVVFHGIGGYESFGQANPISPFLKGGKWLSGLGFLHFSGQALGWLDVISVLALTLILIIVFLRKYNRYLLVFAFLWFVVATLPFHFVTATYHYVFVFPLIGITVALILSVNKLTFKPVLLLSRILLISASVLITVIWTYENKLGVANVANTINGQVASAKQIYDYIGNKHDPVIIFLATEKYDYRPIIRLTLWHYPVTVEVKKIILSEKYIDVNDLVIADQTSSARRIYAWQRGEDYSFYPSLDILLQEIRRSGESAKIDAAR